MKKIKWFSIFWIVVLLAGCSSKSDMEATESYDTANDNAMKEVGEVIECDSGLEETNESVSSNRKIIEHVYMDVETKEFDDLLDKIYDEVEKSGGYIEKSSVSGNSYSYDGNRYADFTIRVPSDKSDGFVEFVSYNSTVTNKEIITDDVTLSYVDTESRVSALETEKAALEKLLENAEILEDIIKIQDRLTDVIYEIESYKSQLRTYDNLIDYTTIGINVREVERVTILEEQTVWEEIKTNLGDNMGDIGKGIVNIFIFVISNIPYFAMIGVVVIVILTIVKKVKKK